MYDPSIRDRELRSVGIAICYNSAINFGTRKIGRRTFQSPAITRNKQKMLQIIQQSQKETKTAIFGNCDWLHVTTGNLILGEKHQQKKQELLQSSTNLVCCQRASKWKKFEDVKVQTLSSILNFDTKELISRHPFWIRLQKKKTCITSCLFPFLSAYLWEESYMI